MAATCNFKDFLNDALRDRFVCGIAGAHKQTDLLKISDLTFVKAVDTAQNCEMTRTQMKMIKQDSDVNLIHQNFQEGKSSHNSSYNRKPANSYNISYSTRGNYGRGKSQSRGQRRQHETNDNTNTATSDLKKKNNSVYKCGGPNHYNYQCLQKKRDRNMQQKVNLIDGNNDINDNWSSDDIKENSDEISQINNLSCVRASQNRFERNEIVSKKSNVYQVDNLYINNLEHSINKAEYVLLLVEKKNNFNGKSIPLQEYLL